jgi:hypothetical protein
MPAVKREDSFRKKPYSKKKNLNLFVERKKEENLEK